MNKLKELVSKGMEGDWRPDNIECADMKSCTNSHVTFTYESTATEILYGADLFVTLPPLSVNDLINDDEFMKVVFGEEPVVTMRLIINRHTIQAARCEIIKMNAIILSGDAQVKYLHKMMKEVGNGM